MKKKIRDLVYGFIELDEQECAIIDHSTFQRLRRIKQLALTDMVYPGANHSRFEHSLGVMQMATDMFDNIISKNANRTLLNNAFSLDDSGLKRYRKIIRLAALLHDIGHAPFSHSGEGLMPFLPTTHTDYIEGQDKRYRHEEYSIAIIKSVFKEFIENHPINNNHDIKVEDVTLLLGDTGVKPKQSALLWKELISGQVDADRADYLLRDSLHLGINYGVYDRNRLVNCMAIGKSETDDYVLAIEEGAWHIAESLVIARYQMFTQVYFHKVRRIYDYHSREAIKTILCAKKYPGVVYPSPECINEYLHFDDWTIYSALKEGLGGIHGKLWLYRNHYKQVACTNDIPTTEDKQKIAKLQAEHEAAGTGYFLDEASGKWYSIDKDVPILLGNGSTQSLSEKSSIVKAMVDTNMQRFYIPSPAR
jgi:hypothetical protein